MLIYTRNAAYAGNMFVCSRPLKDVIVVIDCQSPVAPSSFTSSKRCNCDYRFVKLYQIGRQLTYLVECTRNLIRPSFRRSSDKAPYQPLDISITNQFASRLGGHPTSVKRPSHDAFLSSSSSPLHTHLFWLTKTLNFTREHATTSHPSSIGSISGT